VRDCRPRLLDLGGGYPVQLTEATPSIEAIGTLIGQELAQFNRDVEVIAEPGRFMVADAGCFVAHVIGTALRHGQRWMHWDAGVFGGLFETIDGLRYNLHAERDGVRVPWHVGGPPATRSTCACATSCCPRISSKGIRSTC